MESLAAFMRGVVDPDQLSPVARRFRGLYGAIIFSSFRGQSINAWFFTNGRNFV